MSLDVTIYESKKIKCDCGKIHEYKTDMVYDANITHNLNTMAEAAGIYEALWKPHLLSCDRNLIQYEDNFIVHSSDIIKPIEKGLKKLKSNPSKYSKYNSPNGWGTYEHFVQFVEKYLNALKEYPNGIIKVSR